MEKRIGWSATAVSVSAGIVLGIYEVMGWTMPDLVALILVIIASLAGFVALLVLAHAIWTSTGQFRQRYGCRFPI